MPGHANSNVLTVLQKDKAIDLQAAADYVGVYFRGLIDRFEADKSLLPSFGEELDVIIKLAITHGPFFLCLVANHVYRNHITMMENWVAGSLNWSFATDRYFGEEHLKDRKSVV